MPPNNAPIPPRKEPTGAPHLPLARIKKMIMLDQEIHICAASAAFTIAIATEMFIQYMAEQGHNVVKSEKKPRRNIQYRDLANAVSRLDNLEFLTDVVPKTIPFKEIKSKKVPSSTDPTSGATETTTAGPLDNLVASSNGTNGNASGFSAINVVNGNGKTPAREDDDDPNAQLEMESRRRSGVSNGGGETLQDVEMS